jgi:hypothetical protein
MSPTTAPVATATPIMIQKATPSPTQTVNPTINPSPTTPDTSTNPAVQSNFLPVTAGLAIFIVAIIFITIIYGIKHPSPEEPEEKGKYSPF